MSGSRGIVGEKWSQRILWLCAIGSAISLYFVGVERQTQNHLRKMAEGFDDIDDSENSGGDGT
ncbi:uncharacterized protein LOC122017201 [Zingiber officinale]|uniref:uncharacterized protein LOC122017201 n=1 Tax=Zingiber officinale TaxID=94328 RepID=UPI001C4A985A|nr:uncharacterized protein LOC122017201 [Zingiber officinale]XP_042430688.1 uncharacterized protein LOC122017201 [Zingiber officinale]XP_042430689.1 uncharacterized protein LOC122017201 [Zingiber officinale]